VPRRRRGVCQPVNFNCPGQIVVAGNVEAVDEVVVGPGGRVVQIRSPERFRGVSFVVDETSGGQNGDRFWRRHDRFPAVPVVANVDAQPVQDPQQIREKLVHQIDHAVLWEDTLRFMIGAGVETFIEMGPGRVCRGSCGAPTRRENFLI
jgi:[acyl-carrier-protein] S-malonyltransferase